MLKLIPNQFEVETLCSSDDILKRIEERKLSQKSHRFLFSSEFVNYKNFKIDGNQIIIERWQSIVSPFRGTGIINFEIISSDIETRIKCTIETPGFWFMLGLVSFMMLFLTFVILFISITDENYGQGILFSLALWIFAFLSAYLPFVFNRNQLVDFAKMILRDLELGV
jgi:hypothetical protein